MVGNLKTKKIHQRPRVSYKKENFEKESVCEWENEREKEKEWKGERKRDRDSKKKKQFAEKSECLCSKAIEWEGRKPQSKQITQILNSKGTEN